MLVTCLRHTNQASGEVPPAYTEIGAADGSAVVERIVAGEGRAVAAEADLAEAGAIPALFDRAEAELGPARIVVNSTSGWVADTFRAATTDEPSRASAPSPPPPSTG